MLPHTGLWRFLLPVPCTAPRSASRFPSWRTWWVAKVLVWHIFPLDVLVFSVKLFFFLWWSILCYLHSLTLKGDGGHILFLNDWPYSLPWMGFRTHYPKTQHLGILNILNRRSLRKQPKQEGRSDNTPRPHLPRNSLFLLKAEDKSCCESYPLCTRSRADILITREGNLGLRHVCKQTLLFLHCFTTPRPKPNVLSFL